MTDDGKKADDVLSELRAIRARQLAWPDVFLSVLFALIAFAAICWAVWFVWELALRRP